MPIAYMMEHCAQANHIICSSKYIEFNVSIAVSISDGYTSPQCLMLYRFCIRHVSNASTVTFIAAPLTTLPKTNYYSTLLHYPQNE